MQHLPIRQAVRTSWFLDIRTHSPTIEIIKKVQLDMDKGFALAIGDQFFMDTDAYRPETVPALKFSILIIVQISTVCYRNNWLR